MPDQGPGFRTSVLHPDLAIARLRDAVVVPGGIILRRDEVVLDSFSAPWEAYQHRHMTARDAGWHLDDRPARTGAITGSIERPVLFLDHQHLDWYGHVMLDLLPQAWAYEYLAAYLGVGELSIVCTRPRFGFVERLFRAAGMDAGRCSFIEQPVLCSELFVATKAVQIQQYATAPAVRLWSRIRERTMTHHASAIEKVYVSRSNNPTRRLVEEEEVEAMFRRRGFTVIHPELLPVEKQIAIFGNARLIAGCSGSNMFNIAFQNKARAILILVSPLLVHYSEHLLHLGHDGTSLDVLVGYTVDAELLAVPGNVHASWHVDPVVLAEFVDRWMDRTG